MILEGRQVIFKTLSALQPFCGFCPPWGSAACLLTPDKSSRVLPGHLQQLVDGLCVGKQLACHLLPCSLPLRQHPEQLDGADAAVPSTRQKLLFEHCPSHWDFECLLLMALVQTNGKPTWYKSVVITSKWIISSVLLIFLNKPDTTFLEDVYTVSGLFHCKTGFTPLMSVSRRVERTWPQSSIHGHVISKTTFIP